MTWNLKKASAWARDKLQKANIKNFELDIDVLLTHVIDRPRHFVLTYPDYQMTFENMRVFENYIFRRERHEPIHYILKSKEFWSLQFYVNHNVLIPRPETEHLIEHFLDLVRDQKTEKSLLEILDVGVGSGNISVTILKELPFAKVTATDISKGALKVAKRNAIDHGVLNRINFCWGDLFPKAGLLPEKFDFILSNPPYIAWKNFEFVEPEVADFEPKVALISGETGLEICQRLISKTLNRLKAGGYLILEIGDGQFEKVKSLIDQSEGFNKVLAVFDYSGKPRIISARKKLNG